VALGPGIHAGTTDIAVDRAVRHSGLDAGIQGWIGVIGQTWAVCWLRVTVRGTGSRHPCRDDGGRGCPLGLSFRLGCRNPGPGRGDRSNVGAVPAEGYRPWHWVPASVPGRRRSRLTARFVIPARMPESRARQGHCSTVSGVLVAGYRPWHWVPASVPGRRRSRLTARSVIPARMPESRARQGHCSTVSGVLVAGYRPWHWVPASMPGRRTSRLTARSVIPAWMPESRAG